MKFILPSGIFTTSGEPLPDGDDMEAVAATAESELWTQTQEARVERLQSAQRLLYLGLFLGVGLALLGLAAMHSVAITVCGILVAVAAWAIAASIENSAGQLEPDEQVDAVYRFHWPLLALPVGRKSLLHDLACSTPSVEITSRVLRRPEVLSGAQDALRRKLDELNFFEPHDEKTVVDGQELFGVDAALCQRLKELLQGLDDTEEVRVRISALPKDSAVAQRLLGWRCRMHDGPVSPQVACISEKTALERHLALQGAHMSAVTVPCDPSGVLNELNQVIDGQIRPLESAHTDSLALIRKQSSVALRSETRISWATFCPRCNTTTSGQRREQLTEASRLEFDFAHEVWRCPVCRWEIGRSAAGTGAADAAAKETLRSPLPGLMDDELEGDARLPVALPITVDPFVHEIATPILMKFLDSYHTEILAIDRTLDDQLAQVRRERDVKVQEHSFELGREKRRRGLEIMQQGKQAKALQMQIVGLGTALAAYKALTDQQLEKFRTESRELARRAEHEARALHEAYRKDFDERLRQAQATEVEMARQQKIEEDARTLQVRDATDKVQRALLLTDQQREGLQAGMFSGPWSGAAKTRLNDQLDNAAQALS